MVNERWTGAPHERGSRVDDRSGFNPAEDAELNDLAEKLVVSREDVLDAIEQVGADRQKIEEMLRGRENSH